MSVLRDILARHSSRCLDDVDDRSAVAAALEAHNETIGAAVHANAEGVNDIAATLAAMPGQRTIDERDLAAMAAELGILAHALDTQATALGFAPGRGSVRRRRRGARK